MNGWTDDRARQALASLWQAALSAADPLSCLPSFLPEPPAQGRIVVVGAGKAAAKMALAVEKAWAHLPLSGVVVTTHGADVADAPANRRIAVRQANHPTPDAPGAAAAAEMLEQVRGLGEQDLVLALISGGGSSLSTLPAPGLTLDELIAVNRELLRSGAPIHEMNCIRKHLSAFSGGRLAAAAHPARVVTLAISDVPGDDPGVIASGPTVPDPTSFAEARALVAHYGMNLPPAVTAHLAAGAEESIKPGDPRLARAEYRMIATPMMALRAMADAAPALGLTPIILGDALEGEARQLGTALAGIAISAATHGVPVRGPAVILSGGETTVTIQPGTDGRGGRGTECLLGMALALNGRPGIWAMCADTDGIDGRSDAAGALCLPGTLADCGMDCRAALAAHRSYDVFAAANTLMKTGPTLTNVNDVRAIIVAGQQE
ncbi:glycerate kinase [Rhodovarius crocodyli]|uniref:Glycerate kinase n=1 Tax=Rhodovarius crocodyli TaxID=1979269 RepID=A0A437M3I2_9PROT|nr:glycerate kinase [Rhodovarius crocodyli]RVT92258.1 glycerate kinase [Rhodovarius crocodyli]